jgi:hypothetical protein
VLWVNSLHDIQHRWSNNILEALHWRISQPNSNASSSISDMQKLCNWQSWLSKCLHYPEPEITCYVSSIYYKWGTIYQVTIFHLLKVWCHLLFNCVIIFYEEYSYVRNMRCIRKFPECYCCNCLCEIRWEGRTRSHFHKPIASVCHMKPRCKHALFLH